MRRIRVLSLFSGCGGLDLGFRGGFRFLGNSYRAHPCEIIWANDVSKAACRTYRNNIGAHIHHGDIWDRLSECPQKVDVVIGGFPCQDISVNGKGLGIAGKRSGLYRAMVKVVSRCRPKVFVAENVKGLLMPQNLASLERILSDFKSLGYNVSYNLYDASNYGVPQNRERVFIVGVTKGRFTPPRPIGGKHVTVKQAISNLVDVPESVSMNHKSVSMNHKSVSMNHIWSRAQKSGGQGYRVMKANRPGLGTPSGLSATEIPTSTTNFLGVSPCANLLAFNRFLMTSFLLVASDKLNDKSAMRFRQFWRGTLPIPFVSCCEDDRTSNSKFDHPQ